MGEKTLFLPKKSSNGKNTYDSTQRVLRKGINICQCSPRKVGGRFQMRGAISVGSRRMCRSLRQEHLEEKTTWAEAECQDGGPGRPRTEGVCSPGGEQGGLEREPASSDHILERLSSNMLGG